MPKRHIKYKTRFKAHMYTENGKRIKMQTTSKEKSSVGNSNISSMDLIFPAPEQEAETSGAKRDSYQCRKGKEYERWQEMTQDFLHCRTEEMCPGSFICVLCGNEEENIVHCRDCGHAAFYCCKCCVIIHKFVTFHNPCLWKGDMYVPFPLNVHLRVTGHSISCSSSYTTEVLVFNKNGQQQPVTLTFCECEKEAITMLRYNLWPSSPENPRVGYALELIECAAMLQLEAHVPLKAFCNAIQKMHNWLPSQPLKSKTKSLYGCLGRDSFQQYRYHRSSFQTFCDEALSPQANTCPVCNLDPTSRILCLDGNFCLVHKKSSGVGVGLENTRHNNRFFLSQTEVDNFVSQYYADKKTDQDCSNFQAGNILRSKRKSEKLDIFGVFGSVCHHDVPQVFINMRHGERLAYPVFILQKIKECQENEADNVTIMYDIACTLKKHLMKQKQEDMLTFFKMVVPVFHSYAHNLPCQMEYGQRFVEGTGLVDGEGTERLWSYLRGFSKISKEMTLTNRHDLLHDALLHFSFSVIEKLGQQLLCKLKVAVKTKEENQQAYELCEKKLEGRACKWLTDWKDLERKNLDSNGALTIVEQYWLLKSQEDHKRQTLESNSDEDTKEITRVTLKRLKNKIEKLGRKLKKSETELNNEERTPIIESALQKSKKSCLQKMNLLATERQYILSLLKKYCDGQSIAERISKQLSANSEKLKKSMEDFNNTFNCSVTFHEASNVTSAIYNSDRCSSYLTSEHLKGARAFSLYSHANEQIDRVTCDIQTLLLWVESSNEELLSYITDLEQSGSKRYYLGKKHILMMHKMRFEKLWAGYLNSLSQFTERNFKGPVHEYMNLISEVDNVHVEDIYINEEDSSDDDSD